jgi:hypothetical protein
MSESPTVPKRVLLPPIVITVLFVVLTGFMLILALLIYRVMSVPDAEFNMLKGIPVYEKLALIVILAWVALLIAYYAWQIYFYNYNYGKSSAFWKRFVELSMADDRKSEAQLYKEFAAPDKNPFQDQTFGLPPGTVRGTMALTVLVGGLCLLILAIGGSDLFNQPAFERQLNFFEQAFLMVIAFYFGTKGFEIMQQEQTKRMAVRMDKPAGKKPAAVAAPSPTEMESPVVAAIPAGAAVASPVTEQQPGVMPPEAAAPPALLVDKDVIVKNLDQHYPHVIDLEERRYLQPEQIALFAENHQLEVPTVKAVIEVESNGKGFLKDGRPKVLFEGHVFWRRLKAYKIDPGPLAKTQPTIVYPTWTRQHYLTGTLEYQRLQKARAIHDSAALESASWGMFQIMGHHAIKMGFKTVQEYVKNQEKSEAEHLNAFGLFITRISPQCYEALKSKKWDDFARHYNGPQSARNQYNTKLQNDYNKFKNLPGV